jgi:hypothetical protein
MKKEITFVVLSLGALSLMIIPSTSWAIPAWGRKYGASCNMCHRPNVPRLNVVGHTFRKLGYRLEDELEKNPDYKEIGNYVSMRGRLRYDYENSDAAESSNEFSWHDATFFYAGPVTKNLSAFFELEVEEENKTNVVAQMSWFMGTAERYLNVRAGQLHTLSRVGWAGFDRPSGISTTDVFGDTLTTTPVPFKIKQDQQGLELALGVTSDIRIIGQVLNGVNAAGKSTWGSEDDKDKDFLAAYEHIVDERGSGFTIYGYRGIWHQDETSSVFNALAEVDDDDNEFEYYRYGVTASVVADICPLGYTEVLGGVILSRDNVPPDHPTEDENVNGEAYFVEIEQYLTDASIFARADFVNKDTDINDWNSKYIIGSAYMVNDYLRLAGEGFLEEKNPDSLGFTLEAMFNF